MEFQAPAVHKYVCLLNVCSFIGSHIETIFIAAQTYIDVESR